MGQYLPVVALLVLAVLFAAVSFLASKLLAPRSPNAAKSAPIRVRHRAEPGAA